LTPGTQVGPYEVLALLGVGGMGEVYRARDSRLKRDVAIKVLPAEFAQDPDRLARFQREAELLATLNHPNIAAVYGLETADGLTGLVLELVEGDTLADVLARGPLALREALPIALQIAQGLEGAHEQGIIHRDLKPANIKVRENGTVKLLDFGLAKALNAESASAHVLDHSPTITSPVAMTRQGVILGTAAYMSPEQARGRVVDKRADIWAFGAVVYEMLTGRRVFQGDTVSDTLAAVLRSEPDWAALPPTTPFLIKRLLRHCLDKDHRQRLGDIRDARIEMAEALTVPALESAPAAASRRRAGQWVAWGVAGVSLALAIGLGAAWRSSLREVAAKSDIAGAIRFTIAPPDGVSIAGPPQVSPDGQHILFVGVGTAVPSLWLRSLDALSSRSLAGTEFASSPFWSPDSRRVGFFANGKLKTLDLARGAVGIVCDAPNTPGGAWSAQDVIVFAPTPDGPLFRVSAGGGVPVPATRIDVGQGENHRWPQFLPDGQRFIFLDSSAGGVRVSLASLDGGEPRQIAATEARSWFAPPNDLLLIRGGALISHPLDLTQMALTGDAVTLVERIGLGVGLSGAFSVSPTGVLVHRAPDVGLLVRLAFVDRRGKVETVPLRPGLYADPALSPDGQYVALRASDSSGEHIWVYDLARGTFGKRTFEGTNNFPIWTPDGEYLTFTRGQAAFVGPIMRVRADGSGQPEILVSDAQVPGQRIAGSWSGDGRLLAFQANQNVMVREADGTIKAALTTPAFEREGRFAPGGRWLAYRSNETGRDEVYVQSYPPGSGKWQISTDGGAQPMWAPGGRELFYKSGNRLMIADVEMGTTFKAGTPRLLVEMPLPERSAGDPSRFAVTPDGKRFLVITTDAPASAAAPSPIEVVLNWRSGLK